ncbi:MAG: VWA domain-containing protein [Deltaproteobacteria bacterium]|nr:VWA domain-containing protein [Deltaproteobacteria bacterium]
MRFGHVDYIFLLFLLPLLVALLVWKFYRSQKLWKLFAERRFKKILMPSSWPDMHVVKDIFKVLIFIFLVLTLMEPQWGEREEKITLRGVDIMIMVDLSDSMLAQDVSPNRLERQKRKVGDLLNLFKGDRVGLIGFAGKSFLLVPMTNDYNILKRSVQEIDTETLSIPGTNLKEAFQLAVKSFPPSKENKAVILFTDGEDHGEKISELVSIFKEKKMKLFVIGIGTSKGAPIPNPDGGFRKDDAGQLVTSRLGEAYLKELALATGGAYVRAISSDLDLREIYLNGIRGVFNMQDLSVTQRKFYEIRYYWPLGIALILLIIERLLPEAKRVRRKIHG